MDSTQSSHTDLQSLANFEGSDEEENVATGVQFSIKKWVEPDSDNEDSLAAKFDVLGAWNTLFNMKTCQKIMIDVTAQEKLGITVGIHVSQEFPWKQIKYKHFREYVLDNEDTDFNDLILDAFLSFDPEAYILIGYAPLLTQGQDDSPAGDPFIFFINSDDTRNAMAIIQNIEAYENWSIRKRLIKKPREWQSLGSEHEVDLTLPRQFIAPTEIEIQSVYPPTKPENKVMDFRRADDVRDGYIELLPSDLVKYDNVARKRVSVAVQSAPSCVDLEQQTDPPFPSNQWAEYLYELDDNALDLDESSEEEEESKRPSKPETPKSEAEQKPVKPPLEVSGRIKYLLKTLEFNRIDMYRNDYPLITTKQTTRYTNPYLEETLCFANIARSNRRFVCGVDWYPGLSGLIVTSYTFSTPVTIESVSHKVDVIQRAVLYANPILMWSFNDNLNYKLDFESPLETTVLSFCPHHYDLLLGGTINGQIVFWDLQERAENLDNEEILTPAQSTYRAVMKECMQWAVSVDEASIVSPATMTELEHSQRGAITGIYWMGRAFYVNSFGKLNKDLQTDSKRRFFITCAMDGSISFWNLDAMAEHKTQAGQLRSDMPKALSQNQSQYKNKVLQPTFRISFNQPITSLIVTGSTFHCVPEEPLNQRQGKLNFRTTLDLKEPENMDQSLIVSTFYGRIELINWMGVYTETEVENVTTTTPFARVHDGPITIMKKNPFIPSVFISVGRNVFAVWKDDYNYSPIFWRKRSCQLTTAAWSENRPGVFFLTRIDGNLEVWDILARDDDACFDDILGGGIITAISEHRPSEPEKLLGIGDYNSSFRMVRLPESFYVPVPNENELVLAYVNKEITRKKSIQNWEQKFYLNNKDIIEAKRQAEIDARKELERIEKENLMKAHRKALEEGQEITNQRVQNLSYTERMRVEWDALNLRRLMAILMSRKQMDANKLERETALEKRYLAYEAAKKESLERVLQRADEELATIRSRILPFEQPDCQRNDFILDNVNELMNQTYNYNDIEQYASTTLSGFEEFDDIDYLQFLSRGEYRRALLNKTLGGNTERTFWYDEQKNDNNIGDGRWGYDFFLHTEIDGMDEVEASNDPSIPLNEIESAD